VWCSELAGGGAPSDESLGQCCSHWRRPGGVHSRPRRWWPVEGAHALTSGVHPLPTRKQTHGGTGERAFEAKAVRKVGGVVPAAVPKPATRCSQCAPHNRRSEHAATFFRCCCAGEHRLGEQDNNLLSFQPRGVHLQVKLQDTEGAPWPRQFSNGVSHSGACERQGSASAHGAWPCAGRGRNGGRSRLGGAE
jgi:hypothetical protein